MEDFEKAAFALIDKSVQMEEDCIREVLRQLLHREPTEDDAKRRTKIYKSGETDRYILAMDGVQLGVVSMISEPANYRVEFKPNEMFAG